ncbi:EF-hand_domain pair [Hexamita inflata]|uniref:EF-hand_domain pair n=1 Tax=Hexamita inflata TaxID=28002 RepID=A0ABP1HJF6_9EUKA
MSIMDDINNEYDVYKLLFKAMDTNNSNTIDAKELSVFFNTLKINVNPLMFGDKLNQDAFQKVIAPYMNSFVGDDFIPFADVK